MQQNVIEEVPLGLGFEMPEEVWILRFGVTTATTSRDGERFVATWRTEADAWSAREAKKHVKAKSGSFQVGDCLPEITTPDQLRSRVTPCPWVGFLLLDRDWKEIGRRYWA